MSIAIAHDDQYDISDMYLEFNKIEEFYYWIDDNGYIDFVTGINIVGWL